MTSQCHTSGNLQNIRYRSKIQEQWNASFQHTWKYATQQWQAEELLLEYEEGNADDEESHGDQDDD